MLPHLSTHVLTECLLGTGTVLATRASPCLKETEVLGPAERGFPEAGVPKLRPES